MNKKVAEIALANKFIEKSGINPAIEVLRSELTGTRFSDVLDAQGHQYVDLVQQGGGVWGVSLIGFVYVMEQVGIRFFSLAGTSAGAINAMAMAAIGNKDEKKATRILELFLNLELDSFIDGKDSKFYTKCVRGLIRRFIKNSKFANLIKWSIIVLLALLAFSSIVIILYCFNNKISHILLGISVSLWVITIILLIVVFDGRNDVKKGLGLNKGETFEKWVETDILGNHGIKDLQDLKTHFSKVPDSLYLDRVPANRDIGETTPKTARLAFVASDITTQNKIEFPRMWELYFPNLQSVNPAAFVRASMSIPLFFDAYKIILNPKNIESWNDLINWNNKPIPKEVFLVDGGALSNFPINIFHNPKNKTPRMPTIGIRLIEKEQDRADKKFIIKNLTDLAGKIINTMKLSSDKEFINKNPSYNKGIAYVEIDKELSWLNFFMNDAQKEQLFLAGANAAISFLKAFDWDKYKIERTEELKKQIDTATNNPNKW